MNTSEHRSLTVPSKAANTLTVTWGLVSIPLSVYAAVDEGAGVKRQKFTKAGNPIGNRPYDKVTDADYEDDPVMKVAVGDQLVELSDDEIEAVTGSPIKGHCDVLAFVPAEAIGTLYFVQAVKQVRAQAKDPKAGKYHALLCQAMAQEGVVALTKVTLRSATRYAVLTPDGRMLMLHFADEVRGELPIPEAELSDAELNMAKQLVAMVGIDTPRLVDDAGEKVQQYLAAKAAGGEVATVTAAPAVKRDDTSLEELLAASIAAARSQAAETAAA